MPIYGARRRNIDERHRDIRKPVAQPNQRAFEDQYTGVDSILAQSHGRNAKHPGTVRAAVHQYLLLCWLIQDRAGIISIFDEVAGHPEYRVAEMAMAPPTRNGAVLARQEFVDLTAQIIAIRTNPVVVQQDVVVIDVVAFRKIDQYPLWFFNGRE